MKRQRAFSRTELLLAASLLTFGVATACGGGDDASAGHGGSGGASSGGASSGAGGSDVAKGGSGGKTGKGGSGGSGGKAATGGSSQSAAGEQGAPVGGAPDTAPVTGNAGAAGEAPDVNPADKQLLYPAVKFPPENPDSDAKDMLGKILFWDEQVGSDNTQACGTCHRTGAGGGSDPRSGSAASRSPGDDGKLGTDDDVHGSQGIRYCTSGDATTVVYAADPNNIYGLNHQVTGRKAPTYLDAMFAADVFWDGRATSQFIDPVSNVVAIVAGGGLESQAVKPPLNTGEMACNGRSWTTLLLKLGTVVPLSVAKEIPPDMKAAIAAANNTYAGLFEAAFNSKEITATHFAFAIATHERHLTSNQTPWDRYNQYLNDPKTGDPRALTPAQVRGFELFMGKATCNTCHIPPFFSDFQFHNLAFVSSAVDKGRQALPGHATDPRGQVKTANLRNVGLREAQGLFHFGRGPGASLDTVMTAYNTAPRNDGPDNLPTTGDPTGSAVRALGLTGDEIADIIDFLRNGLTDPRVKNQQFPFDKPTLSTE